MAGGSGLVNTRMHEHLAVPGCVEVHLRGVSMEMLQEIAYSHIDNINELGEDDREIASWTRFAALSRLPRV